MRLTKIEFNGYKRLAKTSCNVDGRLIAILGPNEAGKSSVLEGLAWLTDTEAGALPSHLRSRALGDLSDYRAVVAAQFALEDADRDALAGLDTDDVPRYFRLLRLANGNYQSDTVPRLRRRTAPFDAALTSLAKIETRYQQVLTRNKAQTGIGDLLDRVLDVLKAPDDGLDEAHEAFDRVVAWLREPLAPPADAPADAETEERHDPRDDAAADLLVAARTKLEEASVSSEARRLLRDRMPQFLMFEEADRILDSTHNLADPQLHANVPPALRNLLSLADTSVPDLRKVQKTGDTTRIQSLLKQVNLRLAQRLQPTWRQSQITVRLDINGDLLQVLVDEVSDDGARTDIAERSDGLKTFIALVCFLADKDSAVPPVLMIDEAETHLHYDAQADLLDVLLHHVKTSKVIYTTHSPGCLPPDLGTGVRFVSPDPQQRAQSRLRADFWSSDEPGFSPLLFAMGAGAAAFSVCRRAVLAEGASDMILLPSLLRAATGEVDLGYQVAPGLATRTSDLARADVAARVAYLSDGDKPGAKYRDELLAAGVEPDHIHGLPDGQAIEDLLTPDCYLSAVHALMKDAGFTGSLPTIKQLTGKTPVATRLDNWAKRNGQSVPSKRIVASYLVQDSTRIALTAGGKAALQDLHTKFQAVLA